MGTRKFDLPVGKTQGHHGYIRLYVREGDRKRYVYEHRAVMEKFIGRKLKRSEVVHHINGKTSDNRIENLELVTDNGKHRAEHHADAPRDEKGKYIRKQ